MSHEPPPYQQTPQLVNPQGQPVETPPTVAYVPGPNGVLQKVMIKYVNGVMVMEPIVDELGIPAQLPTTQIQTTNSSPVQASATPPLEYEICVQCHGKGTWKDVGGLMAVFASEKPCNLCKGKGKIFKGAYTTRPSQGGTNQQFIGVVGAGGMGMVNVVSSGNMSMISNGQTTTTVMRF